MYPNDFRGAAAQAAEREGCAAKQPPDFRRKRTPNKSRKTHRKNLKPLGGKNWLFKTIVLFFARLGILSERFESAHRGKGARRETPPHFRRKNNPNKSRKHTETLTFRWEKAGCLRKSRFFFREVSTQKDIRLRRRACFKIRALTAGVVANTSGAYDCHILKI